MARYRWTKCITFLLYVGFFYLAVMYMESLKHSVKRVLYPTENRQGSYVSHFTLRNSFVENKTLETTINETIYSKWIKDKIFWSEYAETTVSKGISFHCEDKSSIRHMT